MGQWIDAVMNEYPNFNIVGECWYSNEGGEAFWQKGSKVNPVDPRLPTVMDFRLSIDAPEAFSTETDPWHGLNMLYDHLALDYLFEDPQKILTFLDNHDTDRYLRSMPDSLDTWKQAVTFLLTSRGIPQIYYGTELLMNGTRDGSDGFVRRDMPGGFNGDTTNIFTRQGRTAIQNEAFDYLSKLLKWRRDTVRDVMTYGSLKHFMPTDSLYVYRRKLNDREITVILNGTSKNVTVDMTRYAEILPENSALTDIISDQTVTIKPSMTFTPRQVMILQNF